jgi:hypothetical protein
MFQSDNLNSIPPSDVLADGQIPHSYSGHHGLHGDFYMEESNVTRGCTMSWGKEATPYAPADDYYSADAKVTNGISMAGLAHVNGSDGVLSKVVQDSENWGPSQYMNMGMIAGLQPGPLFQSAVTDDSFQQDTQPPEHSQNEWFFDDATMLQIKTSSPQNLGNTVLEFLETQVVASISKVNRQKYTIKADAFVDNIMCCLKIRIWKCPEKDEDYIVHVHRRSGDAFTFGHLRAQAFNFISARFSGSSPPWADVDDYLPLPPPPPLEVGPLDERDVNPLLDMLGLPIATMQAEAASVLSKMVCEEPSTAKLLCKPGAFDQIEWALGCDDLSVTYPTARLLSVLVLQKDAEHPLAEQNLLTAMIQKAGHAQTEQIVRLELAKATSAAMRRCAPLLSNERAENLQHALKQAIQDMGEGKSSLQARNSLEDALLELPHCCKYK